MEWLRGLYTNDVIQLMITIALLCLNCAAVGAVVRLLHRKLSLLKWLTFTLAFTVMGYIVASALLFTVNWFGIRKALLLQLVAAGAFGAFLLVRAKKSGEPLWAEVDMDLRPHLIPLCLVLAGLVVSWGNFGYFGMGQDQGVYQVKALNLMYGVTGRVYSFSEYEKLETEEEKAAYYDYLIHNQLGLDLIDFTPEENKVLASLRTGGNDEHEHTDGIFHGIPTYPALLALWGTVFGEGNMSGVQTLLYLLAMLTLWFTAENLGLKKGAAALVCVLFMLSPEVVWSSKSTLTEELLALIVTQFIYHLTRAGRPDRKWWSAWMVVMFALVHVSIFVMIPFFMLLYILLYFWQGDRQYIRALRISALGFMGGFTFMTLVAPRYTIRNTAMLWVGPVNVYNIYYIFMGAALLGLALSFVLPRLKVKGGFRSFIGGKGGAWLVRGLILLFLAVAAFLSWRKYGEAGIGQALVTNGMYNMCWMTGLLFLPVALVALIRKPQNYLKDEAGFGILLLFGYAVVFMCCVLKVDISYCYYFGRYLTPYVPVACVVIGLVWTRYSGRLLGVGLVAGSLICAPFDMTMLWRQDDTFSTYETFSRVVQSVSEEDSAVIFEDHGPMFFLPVKTITGNECYAAEEDIEAQAAKLSVRYRNVYIVTSKERSGKPLTRIVDNAFMDDNRSYRPALCPFPLSFLKMTFRYYVYQYESPRSFTAADLYCTRPSEDVSAGIVVPRGEIQYGPYISLSPGTYEVHYKGSGLSGAQCIPTVDNGNPLEYTVVSQSDDEVVVLFTTLVDIQQVEFITCNPNEEPLTVSRITVLTR